MMNAFDTNAASTPPQSRRRKRPQLEGPREEALTKPTLRTRKQENFLLVARLMSPATWTCLIYLCFCLSPVVCWAKDQTISVGDGILQFTVLRRVYVPIKTIDHNNPPSAEALKKRYAVAFDLFLKNVGKTEVTVPTYAGSEKLRRRGSGHGIETYDLHFILDNEPEGIFVVSPSVYHFVTLRPGEATWLPSHGVATEDEALLPDYVFVYHVEPEFGKRYDCWSGILKVISEKQSKPVSKKSKPN